MPRFSSMLNTTVTEFGMPGKLVFDSVLVSDNLRRQRPISRSSPILRPDGAGFGSIIGDTVSATR